MGGGKFFRVLTVSAVLALGLVVFSGGAHALNGSFKGAHSARILLPEPTEASRACGLDQNLLEAAVQGPLNATKLLTDAPGNPDFFLRIDLSTVRASGGDCVSNVSLTAVKNEDVKFSFSQIKRSFPVILFAHGELLVSPAAVHAGTVQAGLGRIVQTFSSAYDLDTRW